jgi:hypothetical protein
LDIQEGKEKSYNYGRIAMLIDVYFPSTRPAYDKIIESRTELNKIEGAYKRTYENGDDDGARFITPYVQCQHSIEQAGEDFKMLLLESIRAL